MRVRFEDNSQKFLKESEEKKNKILTAVGLKAVSIWKKIITAKKVVDTGRFRNSCNYETKKDKVVIGNVTKYSIFLEMGTHKMEARPTLTPTILEHKKDYKKIAETIWKSN